MQEVYQYVDLGNSHNIRFQKNHPELPTGKPVVLYFTLPDGVPDFGVAPNLELLEKLKLDVADYSK